MRDKSDEGGGRTVPIAIASEGSRITGTTITGKTNDADPGVEELNLACGISKHARTLGILEQHSSLLPCDECAGQVPALQHAISESEEDVIMPAQSEA